MRSIPAMMLGVAVLAGATGALACGPFFPWQLLDDRSATLHHLPVDSFFFQATHLLPRPDPALDGSAPSVDQHCSDLNDPAAGPSSDRYREGAGAFRGGDLATAATAFRDVLSGGPRTVHAVCAAFMLGRTLDRSGDPVGARAAFLRTRVIAGQGAPDPLGLAVVSFGEQARLSLRDSGLVVDLEPKPQSTPPSPERLAALHQAATLYAQQAAYGAQSGVNSLQELAQALFSDQPGAQDWFDAAVSEPRIRQLLVAYALADTPAVETGSEEVDANPLLGSLDSGPVTARLLDRLAPVFDPAADPRDAGRLAAVAYIAGRYDLAARFAAAPADPLSAWVRAKLSMQHDDLAATARAFADAVHVLASHPDRLGESSDRLRVDPAVISVAGGDFVPALRALFSFGDTYWGDAAYVAERLVTTDELRGFVAALPRPQSHADNGSPDRRLSIRDLLARRLMREGAFDVAIPLFTDPAVSAKAAQYEAALARSRTAFWRNDRARAAWEAALLARTDGMSLFATEVEPDEAVLGGNYDGGFGPQKPPRGALVTALEARRFAETAPVPDRRFHYRAQAAALAERAAALVPARSQAYQATLCQGAAWLLQTDDTPGAARLYHLYVSRGAFLPKAGPFGEACADPDFAAAARQRWALPFREVGWSLRRHWRGLLHRIGV